MTATEYLTKRGWIVACEAWRKAHPKASAIWTDGTAAADDGGTGWIAESDAVAVQRARDEAEERAAWVQFAAAEKCNPHEADQLLAAYRARFAVEVTP